MKRNRSCGSDKKEAKYINPRDEAMNGSSHCSGLQELTVFYTFNDT
jgi:hypothetical protein